MYRTGKGVGLGGSGAGVGARAVARWRGKALVAAFALLGGLPAVPGAAVLVSQEGPSPAVRETVSRVLEIFESRGREPLDRFAWDVLAPAYRATFDGDALVQRLEAVREAGRGRTSDVEVRRRADGGLDLVLADGVRFIVELDEDARIVRLETAPPAAGFEGDAPDGAAPELASWEGLGAWLEAETARGFSGVVLARRAGEVVLRRAYGPADRSSGRPVELESAFGIGSTPIDFTITATRLLAARGALRLDAPVSRYLEGVPADRAGLTIAHILAGRSGLPDFHDTAEDWDPDLAWIDRETAVRRILAQPLLFEPGTAKAHSHSAYVLLAAIIEEVSGQPYMRFVRSEILEPLGMSRTGFYGETLDLRAEDFAVGYGSSAMGLPNIPPNWGPASWLVMGSGGMFSTLGDLDRYYAALAAGALPGLTPGWPGGEMALTGGSDRGYFMLLVINEGGDSVLVLANGSGPGSSERRIRRSLVGLVLDQ